MKKPHPADDFAAQIIAEAAYFTAFVQIAPGQRLRAEAQTQAEAEEIGRQMAAEAGKPVLIYAVNAAGRSALAATIPAARR